MKRILCALLISAGGALAQDFEFEDVSESTGLAPSLKGMMGHAAAWGDLNADGWPDLFVGTFADRKPEEYQAGGAKGPVPNQIFINKKGKFEKYTGSDVAWMGRASGAAFADFDNDGFPELVVSNNGRLGKENLLYRNRNGILERITDEAGAPIHLPEVARSLTPIDYDGDGLLDLFVLATITKGPSMLFKNKGDLTFEYMKDALPEDLVGLGVAAGELTKNRWPDLFVGGPNRLFENQKGRFKEVALDHIPTSFEGEDRASSCGVAFGDVDRDGDLDILLGSHTKQPWKEPAKLQLILNHSEPLNPIFEDVTEKVGLAAIPMRAPHVEIQDFDNDGWPDLYASAVTMKDGKIRPLIFKNLGDLTFKETAFEHRKDFPGPDDMQAKERTFAFYEKLVTNKKVMYYAPGPTADFNRDGKLDLFLCSWFPESPSLLLKNNTKTGNYLQVQITGEGLLNREGVGCTVRAFTRGTNKTRRLIATGNVTAVSGYCSGQQPIVHLGLGEHEVCDIIIKLPHGRGTKIQTDVKANQRLEVNIHR